MDSTKNIIIAVILSFVVVAAGTAGYMLIEDWPFLDALYMTMITLTTVGYSEVRTLSKAGRIFTIVLIFSGFGFIVYVAGAVVQFMIEGQIRTVMGRRRLDKNIKRLKDHYIVCGYGRIGRVLCNKLRSKPIDLVVIDKDIELVEIMDEDNILYIAGEAADEANLIRAGITQAKGLVAALATDADNVFLVLTARQLNSELTIIARAGLGASKAKLRAAGANRVESPYEMGASSMAQRILRPTVTSFLDLALADKPKGIQMEEIPVSPSSWLVDVMLRDSGIRQNYNLIIIAIKKSDGSMIFNPSFDATINAGDTVIAVGEEVNLNKLEKILNP
ncbi:MAG: potassium channel protein [Desulfobacteraceae bacterium]|nr:potassium channel protein [Desulfobacteraceae bacterium]